MSLNLLEKMFADKVDLESRNIIAQFIFMNGKELHIKHAYNKQPGAFKKFWNDFIIPFCKDNGIEIISLVDSACTPHDSDIWGSYGFSGRYHSGTRYYYVNSEDYIEKM
jgi:hypothetical protein